MTQITLKGNTIDTKGNLPVVGSVAKNFEATNSALESVQLYDFKGKNIVLNIFPSIDTGVCAASVRTFNKEVSSMPNTVVLCISKDLPFAHKRFCEAEGLENVITLSTFKNNSFENAYEVMMTSGKLEGLLSRAVVVIDKGLNVVYTEQVPEITQEPDYQSVINSIK